MYSYTTREADAVAIYITYYNAVYRGDTNFFSERYVPAVMKHLTKQNAGIATHYKEWPGNTAIIIPLTEQNMRGEIENIDTFAISDARVRREVAKDKENKDATGTMDTVKKKEVDQSKKNIEERKQSVETRKENLADRQKAVEKKKEEIKKDKEAAAKITNPEQKKAKEEEIKKKEEEVKKEERKIAEEQKKVDAAENQVKKSEAAVEKKEQALANKDDSTDKSTTKDTATTKDTTATAKNENQAKKEAELNQREDALKNQNKGDGIYGLNIYYLEVKDYFEGGHYNNILYLINTQTNKIERRSPFRNICGRKYDIFSNGIVVVSHNGDHQKGHKLTLINKDTLAEITTGEENIFWRTFVEIKGNHIYAIIKDINKDDFYLGKFDANLKLVARSKEKIFLNTFITFFNDTIYINREDKAVMVLKESDLSLVNLIKP
jgi:hypothetical protein